MRKANIIGSSALILLCCLLFTQVAQIKQTGREAVGPRVVPYVCLAGIIVFSVVVLVQSLRSREEEGTEFTTRAKAFRSFITLAMYVLYIIGLNTLGFIVSTLLFLFLLSAFYYAKLDKGLIRIAVMSVCVTGLVWALFTFVFKIVLP